MGGGEGGGGVNLSWGERKNFVQGDSDGWRFGHFLLMGGISSQPGCNGKPCFPKIFKAHQIAWFIYTKFLQKTFIFWIHFCILVQYHDWNLLNKFWLLITFGVLSKVPLKVKLKLFKIQNIILPSICRHEW